MRRILPLLLILASLTSVAQTTIRLRTNKAVGEQFTLTLNPGITCYLDWGGDLKDTLLTTTEPITGTLGSSSINVKAEGMTLFDCSGQEVSQIFFTMATGLETLILSNNNIVSLSIGSLTGLRTLWCDSNLITSLDISKQKELESLVASNNSISRLTLPSTGLPNMVDFWVDDNRLSSLSLANSTKIATLNIEGNTLDELTLTPLEEKALAVFMEGNSLDFTSLWNRTSVSRWYGTTQSFSFAEDVYNMGEEFTLDRDLYGENQEGVEQVATGYTFNWYPFTDGVQGEKLTKGYTGDTSADYTVPTGSDQKHLFTFNKPFDDVQLEIKNSKYLAFYLLSNHIQIADPTAVDDISVQNNLRFSIHGSSVTLQADEPTPVTIVSAGGSVCWRGNIYQATNIPLMPGIYFANNIKFRIK